MPTPVANVELAIIPYLCVTPADEAITFYEKAFGATEAARYTDPAGKIGHAELHIGPIVLYLSDEWPEGNVYSPRKYGGVPLSLYLRCPNVDEVVARAVAAGAVVEREIVDQPYGDRSGTIIDPFGFRWFVATPLEQVSVSEVQERVGEAYKVTGAE